MGVRDASISPRPRTLALFALADTCDPAAVATIRERLTDANDDVRFAAACLLTEFQDRSSLNELKRASELFRSDKASKFMVDLNSEQLLASLERITGKSFGPVPMNLVGGASRRPMSPTAGESKNHRFRG